MARELELVGEEEGEEMGGIALPVPQTSEIDAGDRDILNHTAALALWLTGRARAKASALYPADFTGLPQIGITH